MLPSAFSATDVGRVNVATAPFCTRRNYNKSTT
jgi:hypothetical protein